VRILIVAVLALLVFMAIATLRHLDIFHLDNGDFPARFAAWAWIPVYVGLPWVILVSFVHQERAGRARVYAVRHPLLGWVRLYFLLQAVGATILGLGLSYAPGVFDDVWPWTLPALPAGAIGAWILGFAAASWWVPTWAYVATLVALLLLLTALATWQQENAGRGAAPAQSIT
jgi:hypothetical protein